MLGDLTTDEAVARGGDAGVAGRAGGPAPGCSACASPARSAGRPSRTPVGCSDALGAALPVGVAEAFLEPVKDPLGDLVSRYARTHGPFHPADVAQRLGLGVAVVDGALARLAASGRVVHGEFRPGGTGLEWCDAEVLRTLRRRSLAKLRKEVEPVAARGARAVPAAWQGVSDGAAAAGSTRCCARVEQLQGAPVPRQRARDAGAAVPRRRLLPRAARRADRRRRGALGRRGLAAGQRRLGVAAARRHAPTCCCRRPASVADAAARRAARRRSTAGRRCSSAPLSDRVGASVDDAALQTALWDLVWAGHLTNDTLGPLRALLGGGRTSHSSSARRCASAAGTAVRSCRPAPDRRPWPVAGRRLPDARHRRHPPRARAGRGAARPARRRDPRRGRGRAGARRVLRGLPGAQGLRGGRPGAPRLLRRGARRRAVRRARRGRPDARAGRRAARDRGADVGDAGARRLGRPPYAQRQRQRRDEARAVVLAATDPANPYGAALPWPETTAHDGTRAGTSRAARPARWSCSSTARSCSTSSAAARRCCRSEDVGLPRPGRRRAGAGGARRRARQADRRARPTARRR